MDTLTISKILQESGLEQKPSEAIAKIVEEKNNELVTRRDFNLMSMLIIVFTGAGFGYVVSILNTIISKLS